MAVNQIIFKFFLGNMMETSPGPCNICQLMQQLLQINGNTLYLPLTNCLIAHISVAWWF